MPYRIDPKTGTRIYLDPETGRPLINTGGNQGVAPQQMNFTPMNNAQPQPQLPAQPQPQQGGFLKNMGEAVIRPGLRYLEMVGEAVGQAGRTAINLPEYTDLKRKIDQGIATEQEALRYSELNAPIFMNEDERAKFSDPRSAVIETARRTAGGASYVIPGGGSVGTRLASGAVAGSLGAFSEEDANAGDVAVGGLLGLATAGLFEAGSKTLKADFGRRVGEKLSQRGKDIKVAEYVKRMGGKPINREGGNSLLVSMKKVGIKPGDTDEIIKQSDELLDTLAPVVGQQMDELTTAGQSVSTRDLLKDLRNQLKKKMLPSERQKLQGVIREVSEFAGDSPEITPTEFYQLKQAMGKKGRWSSNADADAIATAKIWRDLYIKANNMTDDLLKQNDFDDFLEINKIVHTATNAKSYAERLGNRAPNTNTLGLLDTIYGVGGFGVAGVPGAVASIGVKRILNSPGATAVIGDTLEKSGKGLAKLQPGGQLNPQTRQVLQNVVASGAGSSVPSKDDEQQSNQATQDAYKNNISHSDNILPTAMENQPTAQAKPVDPYAEPVFQGYSLNDIEDAIIMALAEGNNDAVRELEGIYNVAERRVLRQQESTGGDLLADATEKQRAFYGASQIGSQIQTMLDNPQVAQNLSVGPVKGRASKAGELLGTETPEQTELKSRIAVARTVARNALLGANMSEQEIQSFLDSTLDINLPPEILKTRVKVFIDTMNTLSGIPMQ